LQQLENTNLGKYVNNILNYTSGYIIKNFVKKLAWSFCIDMLIENPPDHNYTKNVSVNRGKLYNASTAICLIVQHLEKAFQAVVIKEKQLHKNVKKNIIECARKNIIIKNNLLILY